MLVICLKAGCMKSWFADMLDHHRKRNRKGQTANSKGDCSKSKKRARAGNVPLVNFIEGYQGYAELLLGQITSYRRPD